MTEAVFAIPGDKDRRTGGFIYEATVLRVLNQIGCSTQHLVLPDSFPSPTPPDMAEALRLLDQGPADTPVILDGLVFGAIDPEGLARVRAPVIAMIHHPLGLETGLSADRAAFLRRNEAAALSHATHTIVPSAETARILVSEFGGDPNQITIAPPGFHRPRVERQPCAPPLILSVGLLAPRKGHDVLLDALAQIVDLPWQATIVGRQYDPEVTEALKNQRAKLDLDARVAFAGELPAPELAAMFNAASIFALATRYEGYGMALCEALLYGLPIVSCRAGAVPETTRGAGILVPPDDSPSFAEALRCLLSNPDIAEDHRARALRVSEGLPDWETTARIFADVIRRVSGSRS